jgi:polyphosphate kinase 2 (PPK2 family)
MEIEEKALRLTKDEWVKRCFELTTAEQRRRLDQRQAEAPHTTWHISDEELAEWSASFDTLTR